MVVVKIRENIKIVDFIILELLLLFESNKNHKKKKLF